MKKLILGFAVLAAMCMVSCDSNAEKQEVATDSTAVEAVDSTMVDSAAIVTDSVKVEEVK